MATAKKKTAKKAVKKVIKAPAKKAAKKSAAVSKAGKKQSATSRAKKSTDAPKRKYARKPKAENTVIEEPTLAYAEEANASPSDDVMDAYSYAQEAVNAAMNDFNWTSYDQYDLRPMPRLGRILFLLELEARGYIMRDTLKPFSETSSTLSPERVNLIEIVRLNHENKIISFARFSDLTAADGLVGLPTAYRGGLELLTVESGLAAPSEIEILGETFKRVTNLRAG